MALILFVCTANRCRSPMAAAFARRDLAGLVSGVSVISAGTLGDEGYPVTSEVASVMSRRDHDLSSHRSRPVSWALSEDPDLIIGMTREHVRAVVEALPEVFPKAFTLKDLVSRATGTGPRGAGEALDGYLARVGEGRTLSSLVGQSASDDVADPIGQPLAAHERSADEIESLVNELVDLLWPLHGG